MGDTEILCPCPLGPKITCVIEDAEKARISAEKVYPGGPLTTADPSVASSAEKACSDVPADAPDVPDGSNTGFSAEKIPPCVFFTDGSGYEDHVGAAAVIPTELDSDRKRHLGKADQSTVYLAELSGSEMALQSFPNRGDVRVILDEWWK